MEEKFNQTKLENAQIRIILSNLIDVAIPLTPILYSYYIKQLVIFDYLTFFELLGIVYLIFNLIAYSFSKGSTIGENLNKIFLADVKTNEKNHLKNIARILFISSAIFYLQSNVNFDYIIFAVLFFLIFPVKFIYKDITIYSVLNYLLKIQYRERYNEVVNQNNL